MSVQSTGSTLNIWDIMSGIGSFVIIILILVLTYYVTRWYARKMQGGAGAVTGRYMKVVERVSLSQTASLLIVEVNGRYYLVGVSDRNMQLLCELEDFQDFIRDTPAVPQESFGKVFRTFMDKAKHSKNNRDDGGAG